MLARDHRQRIHEVLHLTHVSADDLVADESLVPAQLCGKHLGQIYVIHALFVEEVCVQDVRGSDVAVQYCVVGIYFDVVLGSTEDGVAGDAECLGSVGESDAYYTVVLYILRACRDMAMLFFRQAGGCVSDVTADLLDGDLLAACRCFLALQPQHTGQRMGTGTNQAAAAGLVPVSGQRAGGTLQAFLALHEEELALLGADDLCCLLYRGCIYEVLCVHEFAVAGFYYRAQLIHFLHACLIHLALRHGLADILLTALAEITGQRLLADDMLACFDSFFATRV